MRQQFVADYSTSRTRDWRPAAVYSLLLGNFALLGITIGGQGVLWAELLGQLQIHMGAFGSAQLVSPLISVALLLLGGQLAAWAGKQRLAVTSLLLLGAGALILAGSIDLWALVGALLLLGAGNGLFELSMNGAALDWEQASGRSALNVLQASYSAAAVVGALGSGALLGRGYSAGQVLLLIALLSGLMAFATLLVRYPPVDARAVDTASPGATIRLLFSRRGLLALALICMLGAVGESVANLWSVIYLRDLGADSMIGGTTFALLSGAMFAGRLANAPLVDRLGPRASLAISGVGLLLATVLLLIPGGVPLAIAAFMLLGLAVAGVVPTVLGGHGRQLEIYQAPARALLEQAGMAMLA